MTEVLTYTSPAVWFVVLLGYLYLMRRGYTPKWPDVFIPVSGLLVTSLINVAILLAKGSQ